MSLTLYYHPLASFCWKALVALYECDVKFEPRFIDLGKPEQRAELESVSPMVKFPVLRDEARGQTIPEATVIIEYLAQNYPGKSELIPKAPDRAIEARWRDRFYDLYLHEQMQRVVGDRIRPAGKGDPFGVEEAKGRIRSAYAVIEREMAEGRKQWAMGETFTIVDCAACPALFYADRVAPIGGEHPQVTAYLERLRARPSFARVLEEAKPYFHMFPG
jgi:glutathione S-transferase